MGAEEDADVHRGTRQDAIARARGRVDRERGYSGRRREGERATVTGRERRSERVRGRRRAEEPRKPKISGRVAAQGYLCAQHAGADADVEPIQPRQAAASGPRAADVPVEGVPRRLLTRVVGIGSCYQNENLVSVIHTSGALSTTPWKPNRHSVSQNGHSHPARRPGRSRGEATSDTDEVGSLRQRRRRRR